jgi:hypothetical protein
MMADDNASTRDDARVDAARVLVGQADAVERLRGWGVLATAFAAASFVAVAGVAPPGWVAVPVVSAVLGGYLLIRHARARAAFRRSFAELSDRFAIPAAARNDPRRYFDDHAVPHGVPAPAQPARLPTGLVALVLLALGVLVRFLL